MQIFASTHSQECLVALSRAATEWQKDISFVRTVEDGGKFGVEQFHASTILGAMKIGDVR